MITNLITSKLVKNYRLQVSCLNDFLLKFTCFNFQYILKNMGSRISSAITIYNIGFKNRTKLLMLSRIFENLKLFKFKMFTNYNFVHRRRAKSKLYFRIDFSFLNDILDFYNFFLAKLATRSRTLTRSFFFKSFFQINFYDYSLLGFFDKQIDYYGWQEPIIVRVQMNRTSLRKKTDVQRFLSDYKNYFTFFVLKLQFSSKLGMGSSKFY